MARRNRSSLSLSSRTLRARFSSSPMLKRAWAMSPANSANSSLSSASSAARAGRETTMMP